MKVYQTDKVVEREEVSKDTKKHGFRIARAESIRNPLNGNYELHMRLIDSDGKNCSYVLSNQKSYQEFYIEMGVLHSEGLEGKEVIGWVKPHAIALEGISVLREQKRDKKNGKRNSSKLTLDSVLAFTY